MLVESQASHAGVGDRSVATCVSHASLIRVLQRDPLEFLALFLPSERRVLSRTGVSLHCLDYWSDAMAPYVGRKVRVDVHYDPRDVGFVYARLPGGALVRAAMTTPGVGRISLAEWIVRRHYERRVCKTSSRSQACLDSRERAHALVEDAKASRRVRKRLASAAAGDRWVSRDNMETKEETAPAQDAEEQAIPMDVEAFEFEGV